MMWSTELTLLPLNTFVPVISTLVLCTVAYYCAKWVAGNGVVPVKNTRKKHNWKPVTTNSKCWYCNICECLLLNNIGVYCDFCGVCSDSECIEKANKYLQCKVITSKSEVQLHHWVKGNLPLGAMCLICDDDCSMETGLVDYRCCWCQRTVHTNCMKLVEKECDFGPFKDIIVPPSCVQIARMRSSINRNLLLTGVKDPGWENWSPLVVMANRKSGNNDGATVLSQFRRYLNPVQVIDLAERAPSVALQWCVFIPKRVRILVGGGDGTVSWVLATFMKMDLKPPPLVAVLPLGTGNDLSRVLGWGKETSSDIDVCKIISDIRSATLEDIDCWKVEILQHKHLGIRMPSKSLYMFNYFSIGVDAQVALGFHRAREGKFYLFGSRCFNKILYLMFGTQQVVAADCKNIQDRLELYLDGTHVELPELEAIVVLNISSWGAGVDLWGMIGDVPSQSHKDGMLEVIGIYSSFHIAQLQVGLSAPYSIGQAKNVEICVKGKSPVQVDGEPWEQAPCSIKISWVTRESILVNRPKSI